MRPLPTLEKATTSTGNSVHRCSAPSALVRAGRNADARPALDEIETAYRTDAVKNAASLHASSRSAGPNGGFTRAMPQARRACSRDSSRKSTTLRKALRRCCAVRSRQPPRLHLARSEFSAAQHYASAGTAYASQVAHDPNQSANHGRALVLLARAQHAVGQNTTALRTLRQALPALAAGLGPDHAEVSNAQSLITVWSLR